MQLFKIFFKEIGGTRQVWAQFSEYELRNSPYNEIFEDASAIYYASTGNDVMIEPVKIEPSKNREISDIFKRFQDWCEKH